MKTILVSGVSGIVGYGILRSLRKAYPDIKLIGTTIYDDSVAPAFSDIFVKAPLTTDDNYLGWLLETIKKHKVDMIIPGIDIDMITWNENREKLSKSGALILLNNPELIKLSSDKWNFYQKLKASGSKLTIESRIKGTYSELRKDLGQPFLLKPRKGFGSKGIVRPASEEEFNLHQENLGKIVMAQPIVGTDDEEYSVSAFFDKDSNLIYKMGLRRKLSKEGYTEKAEVAEPDNIESAINELSRLFKPIGPTNFQFRQHNGQLKLLEINPRISSATSIRMAFGYNESSMSIEYFLNGKKPAKPQIRMGYAVRYIEDYIFYDSHTV